LAGCQVHGSVFDVLEHVGIFTKTDEPKLLSAEAPEVSTREEAELESLFAKQEGRGPAQQSVV
jgi:hypothetical protein